jgi:hypothetical protein
MGLVRLFEACYFGRSQSSGTASLKMAATLHAEEYMIVTPAVVNMETGFPTASSFWTGLGTKVSYGSQPRYPIQADHQPGPLPTHRLVQLPDELPI